MSCRYYRWAWSQPLLGNRKLVLLALVERADDAGECYPSITRLGQDTGLNRKTIIAALADLEAAGLIRKQRQAGTSSTYQLNAQDDAPPVPKTGPVPKVGPVPKTGRGRPKNGTGGSTENGTQNPPLNPSITPQGDKAAPTAVAAPTPSRPPPSPPPRRRSRPPDFAISAAVQRWAAAKGFTDLDAHFEHFCEKADARGYQYVDWDAALRTAIREDWAGLRGQQPYRNAGGGQRHETHQRPLSAVERCRRASAEWVATKQQADIIDLNDYRPEHPGPGQAVGPPGSDLWAPLDLPAR